MQIKHCIFMSRYINPKVKLLPMLHIIHEQANDSKPEVVCVSLTLHCESLTSFPNLSLFSRHEKYIYTWKHHTNANLPPLDNMWLSGKVPRSRTAQSLTGLCLFPNRYSVSWLLIRKPIYVGGADNNATSKFRRLGLIWFALIQMNNFAEIKENVVH